MSSQEIAERIKRLRLASGLGQVEFADRAGIATGSVSHLERNMARLTDELIAAVAAALDCSPEFLVRDSGVLATRPWFRAYADASRRAMNTEIASAELAIEVVEILKLQRLPDSLPLFDGDLTDGDAIEQFAMDVRSAGGVEEDAVVGNVTRAAERLGCIVLPMGQELGRHLGLSLRVNSLPVVRVSRPSLDPDRNVPGDRQRFTLAHELGHLTLHSGLAAPTTPKDATEIERQAHRFAGAFLCPGDSLMLDLDEFGGRVTLRTLALIKERWGVAIKMLIKRFSDLGVIDSDQSRSLYKQISARGWNKHEPVLVGNESALWFKAALERRAVAGNTDSLERAARDTGLGRRHVEPWLNWTPTPRNDAPADVVKLHPRRTARAVDTRTAWSATVSPFRRPN